MRAPILVFTGGLRVYSSRVAAERALASGGARPVEAFDASGRSLQLVSGGRGWFGFARAEGVHLEAGPATAEGPRALRRRLADAVVQAGASKAWAEGAPLGALVEDAVRRFGA
jgi:hypothetical protein